MIKIKYLTIYLFIDVIIILLFMKFNKKLVLPVTLAVIVYLLSYGIPKVVVNINDVHYLKYAIDDIIPLFSPSIVIYIMAFGQWALALIVLLKQDTNQGYRMASAIIIGSLIGMITFIVYPTAITRTQIEVHNIFDKIIVYIYSLDSIVNACPSFHCFCSTIVIHILWNNKPFNNKFLIVNTIFSIMVFVSTLLTKQHYFIDVPCGILLADFSMLASKKISFNKLFDTINKKLLD